MVTRSGLLKALTFQSFVAVVLVNENIICADYVRWDAHIRRVSKGRVKRTLLCFARLLEVLRRKGELTQMRALRQKPAHRGVI